MVNKFNYLISLPWHSQSHSLIVSCSKPIRYGCKHTWWQFLNAAISKLKLANQNVYQPVKTHWKKQTTTNPLSNHTSWAMFLIPVLPILQQVNDSTVATNYWSCVSQLNYSEWNKSTQTCLTKALFSRVGSFKVTTQTLQFLSQTSLRFLIGLLVPRWEEEQSKKFFMSY